MEVGACLVGVGAGLLGFTLFVLATRGAEARDERVATLIVLGSGGHTTEMLRLIGGLDGARYGPVTLVVAATDDRSRTKAEGWMDHFVMDLGHHGWEREEQVGHVRVTVTGDPALSGGPCWVHENATRAFITGFGSLISESVRAAAAVGVLELLPVAADVSELFVIIIIW